MKMDHLLKFDFPQNLIALWRERESPALLPLQEAAVRKHHLFDAGNLLIQAPTSSGKTFIGEMAALHTALRRKQVVYLVPLKALAEEKYRDFREKYGAYGLKVIVSTRDHRDFDADLENGNFSIAVVVYEKISQLLVRRPERIAEIDLVVADELEILSDPERGAQVELLLTRLLLASCRIIGLSAVIGDAGALATWMEADLVRYERRPVELRHGVLFEGAFRYRTYNEQGEGEETLVDASSDSVWEILAQNVSAFAARRESCLVFAKSKHETRRLAAMLADRVDLPAAENARQALKGLESTRSRTALLEVLQHGVAFHNADLSPAERRIVEDAYRRGEVAVIVSTSTLAIGMNLPARNVFISPEKWRFDPRLDLPWKTAILHTEYENMGGRAGRFGAGHDFGRALLVALTAFEQETFWRRYVEGEREPIQPQLAAGPLENHVLRLIAARLCRTPDSLMSFLERTLTGRWIWAERYTEDEMAHRLRAAISRCVEVEMIQRTTDGALEATPLGQAAAAKGVSMATARELRHWLDMSARRDWTPIDIFIAALTTPDGRMPQVMLTAREYEQANYPGILKRVTAGLDSDVDVPLNRLRRGTLMPFFEDVRAIKVALFLNCWIDGAPLEQIEEDFQTMAGQVLAAADQVAWLLDATVAIGRATCVEDTTLEPLQALVARVQRGVPEEIAPLLTSDAPPMNRRTLLDLWRAGCYTPGALRDQPLQALERHMTAREARVLKDWVARGDKSAPDTNERGEEMIESSTVPVLVVDERYPQRIQIAGEDVLLQEKQFRLVQVLARTPGECVPYERIYRHVWGDAIVEDNQMHFQKRKLVKAIVEVHPDRRDLVKTVPKRGFMLDLAPERVLLREAVATSAA